MAHGLHARLELVPGPELDGKGTGTQERLRHFGRPHFQDDLEDAIVGQLAGNISLAVEEKQKFRSCLCSVSTYRQQIGYPSGPKAKTNPHQQAGFLSGTTEAGERFFLEASKLIYGHNYDTLIDDHVRARRGPKDAIKMTPFKEIFGKVKEDAAADVPEEEEAGEAYETEGDEDDAKSAVGNKSTTPAAKKEESGKGIFLGHFLSGEEIWSKDLTVDTVKKLKSHLQSCTHAVDRDCSFVVIEHDESEDGFAEKIRQHASISRCPDKKKACVYEVGVAAVAQTNPSGNPPSSRRDLYEKHIRGMLISREIGVDTKA